VKGADVFHDAHDGSRRANAAASLLDPVVALRQE